ncbi:MAG: dipeptide epimerase [Paludibacter sp.]|nr:dipeptide epimerase [Paludibacter sp.]
MNRRDFLRSTGMVAGALLISNSVQSFESKLKYKTMRNKYLKLQLSFMPYTLQLRHVFNLAKSSRTTTPVVLIKIEYDGFCGFGEASMPPYLGESHESVIKFLQQLNLAQFSDPFLIHDILDYVENSMNGNYAAKAAIDIAINDLTAKIAGLPLHKIWGLNPAKTPNTSFTIGIDAPDVVKLKVIEAEPYRILKVKLGRENDKEMIETIRSVTDKPICVDINQGWTDRLMALEMIHWLKEKGVVIIEQPMLKTNFDDTAWLTQHSPLPIIADEAFHNISDLERLKGIYSGINIKLMKCGGLTSAREICYLARSYGMKVMIGCMTETSCAVSAAAQLSPLSDWADLDGNLLITNDPFDGMKIIEGKVTLPKQAGIGVVPLKLKTEIAKFLY